MMNQIINQFKTLDNVRDNVRSGRYEFSGSKNSFKDWLAEVERNKGTLASNGKTEEAFARNKELLDEADKLMVPVKTQKKA